MSVTSLLTSSPVATLVGQAIIVFARLVTAVRAHWVGIEPRPEQYIYYANHVSHGDFVLLWTVLPPRMRKTTRPVAGADYWLKSALRRFIGRQVFNAVLIDRDSDSRTDDPVSLMSDALGNGDSLILFPEGTRNTTDEPLLPFKSGLFHLMKANPAVKCIPVWIDNLHRVLPKGEFLPVPMACTVTFGEPLSAPSDIAKDQFLQLAEQALLQLSGQKKHASS